MGAEWELKFKADAESQAQIASDSAVLALCKGTATIRMESRYFDTAEGSLSAKKQTLRLRRENDRSVVTFKTAGEHHLRGEWEYEAETVENAAEKLRELGAPAEQWSEVRPVCGAAFTRRAMGLEWPDGTAAELALDEGELSGGERREAFREIEVEYKAGNRKTVEEFAMALAGKYGLSEQKDSKFLRARRLAEK